MAASETEEAPDPDDDPGCSGEAPNLTTIQAMADQAQNAVCISGRFTAEDTELQTEIFDGWGVRAACAELLDGEREAVYNNHRINRRWW
jgi:hypothetical protein